MVLSGEPTDAVRTATSTLSGGGMVVVRCQGDGSAAVFCLAEHADAEAINFMLKHASGILALAVPPERCDELGLELIEERNRPPGKTPAYTVSVEARTGITTGISAADRARTIAVVVDPASSPEDLVKPGHVFPLKARPGGVLERPRLTEAAVDLAGLSGGTGAVAICQILDEEGRIADLAGLEAFCDRHRLQLLSVDEIVAHVLHHAPLVERRVETMLATEFGDFPAVGYRSTVDGRDYVALTQGDLEAADDVLVDLHRGCTLGDVFGSQACGCRDYLRGSMREIAREGAGILVYIPAVEVADRFPDCPAQEPLEAPEIAATARILDDLGVSSARLADRAPTALAALPSFEMPLVRQG
jgi:3,4-dihydroxy 2-butanone 4-phosphate synthase/GTP cyclohydrolase II